VENRPSIALLLAAGPVTTALAPVTLGSDVELRILRPDQPLQSLEKLLDDGAAHLVAALIDSSRADTLPIARRLQQARPLLQLVFLVRRETEESLSAAMRASGFAGSYWTSVSLDHPQFDRLVQEQIAVGRRRQRHRTTLDKVNLQLQSRAADANTVRRLVISERVLAAVVESSADAIVSLSLQGDIISFNPSAERLWGVPSAQAVSRRLEDFLAEETRPKFLQCMHKVGTTRVFVHRESLGLRPDLSSVPIEMTIAPVLDENRELVALSVTARDISERRKHEIERSALLEKERQARAEAEALYEKVQSTADRLNFSLGALELGHWEWNAATDAMDCSERILEIYGFPSGAKLTREQMRDAVHPEDREETRRAAMASVRGRSEYQIEYRVLHPVRGLTWVSARGRPVFGPEGDIAGMMGVVQDITARKNAELHLRQQRDVLERVVRGDTLAEILGALTDWVERFLTRKVFASIMLATEEGKTLRFAAGKSLPPAWTSAIDRLPVGPEEGSCGTSAFRREGVLTTEIASDPLWKSYAALAAESGLRACWSTPILAANGEVLGTTAIYYTEPTSPTAREFEIVEVVRRTAAIAIERQNSDAALVESRAKLEQYAAELESRVEERTQKLRETIGELEAFSYSISHDMRTPLRAMQGYSEMLLKQHASQLDEEGVHFLQRIEKNAQRLELLVRDVLAYSRVAKEQIALKPVNLGEFLSGLVGQMVEVQTPGVHVEVTGAFPTVWAHEAYLSQVFGNLLGNAIKFMAPGVAPRIEIRAEDEGGMTKVRVCDNGIGIDPAHFSRIFEMFGRVYPDKKFEGTGIGLAIVRKAVYRMGGEVGVESTLGTGTCFWFTLRKL
jgi:PAS domain S-box-containing protein